MTWRMDDREAGDGVAILQEANVAIGTTDDVTRHLLGQPIDGAPEGHALARSSGSQIWRISAMDGEPRAGCLAERKRRPGVIDMVVRDDHPVERSRDLSLLLEEAKDRSNAAGVPGIDDRRSVRRLPPVGLGPANSSDRLNHIPIIGAVLGAGVAFTACGESHLANGRPCISPNELGIPAWRRRIEPR
jgi:hypothetical protein